MALRQSLVDRHHHHVGVRRVSAARPDLEVGGAALERGDEPEHRHVRSGASARLPSVRAQVQERHGHPDGEAHQLVTATAHPPEALGQHAGCSLRPGRGRATVTVLVGVGQIA